MKMLKIKLRISIVSHAEIVACGGKSDPTPTAWFPNTITFTQQPDGNYYLYDKWITYLTHLT